MSKFVVSILGAAFCGLAGFASVPSLAQTGATPAPAATPATAPAPYKRYNVYKENEKAQAALAKRDYRTAIKLFTEVLDSKKLAENWVAPTFFMRGKAFRLSRKNSEAIADYEEAVKLDPKFDIAWYERGLAFQQQEKHALAIESFSKAVELKSANPTYVYSRCVSELFINKLKEAERDCSKAIELKSDYSSALATLGRVFEDQGKKAKAIETYKKVLAIDPGNKSAKDGLAFLGGN